MRAADKVIFIQHDEAGGLEAGSEGFALLPELEQPAGALYVTKTACDAFYHTSLAQVLDEHDIQQFVICGCATDYCLDTTIKKWRQPRVRYCYCGRCPHHRRPPRRAGRDAYHPLQ